MLKAERTSPRERARAAAESAESTRRRVQEEASEEGVGRDDAQRVPGLAAVAAALSRHRCGKPRERKTESVRLSAGATFYDQHRLSAQHGLDAAGGVCPTFRSVQVLEAHDDALDAGIEPAQRGCDATGDEILESGSQRVLAVDCKLRSSSNFLLEFRTF